MPLPSARQWLPWWLHSQRQRRFPRPRSCMMACWNCSDRGLELPLPPRPPRLLLVTSFPDSARRRFPRDAARQSRPRCRTRRSSSLRCVWRSGLRQGSLHPRVHQGQRAHAGRTFLHCPLSAGNNEHNRLGFAWQDEWLEDQQRPLLPEHAEWRRKTSYKLRPQVLARLQPVAAAVAAHFSPAASQAASAATPSSSRSGSQLGRAPCAPPNCPRSRSGPLRGAQALAIGRG